jgi:hypothetical protein
LVEEVVNALRLFKWWTVRGLTAIFVVLVVVLGLAWTPYITHWDSLGYVPQENALIVLCGSEKDRPRAMAEAINMVHVRVDGPEKGTWTREQQDNCDIWYHNPPPTD